jgi:putative solute:sodium symporter small subunit
METKKDEYHISFFNPTTAPARANRNLTLLLVIIWAVAVFGFQILLRVLEKPTPEPTLTEFESVWANVENGNASVEEMQTFAQSTLTVLSKVFLKADDRVVLDNAFTWAVFKIANDETRQELAKAVSTFEEKSAEITDITNTEYIVMRDNLSVLAGSVIGLAPGDIRMSILPLELKTEYKDAYTDENKTQTPVVMTKYLTHNQSVLTDTKFLGFPFHYFYTAVFLLILFVGLCWLYCVRTDAIHKRLSVNDNM